MIILDAIAFTPDAEALFQTVHVGPESRFAGELHALLERAAPVARPKVALAEVFIQAKGEETVTIDGIVFTSRALRTNLDEVERVFPYVATCGAEFDALLADEGDDFLRYCLDCIKEQALFAALEHLRVHLTDSYGLERSATMHPGSGDEDVWPIEQQRPLFDLLGDVEGSIGVRLSSTFLMHPNKTVSGIYFPTEVDFVTCQLCHREGCPNRRAPFDEHMWREKHEGRS